MNQKNTLRIVLLAVIFAGTFLVLNSAAPVSKDKPCKESLEGSCKKDGSGGMIWENLSHQFFSTL